MPPEVAPAPTDGAKLRFPRRGGARPPTSADCPNYRDPILSRRLMSCECRPIRRGPGAGQIAIRIFMARRRGTSSGGTVLLILFGALVAGVSAAYRFVLEHAAAIGVIAFICGLISFPYLASRVRWGRQSSPTSGGFPSPNTGIRPRSPPSPTTPSIGQSPSPRWVRGGEPVKFGNAQLSGGMLSGDRGAGMAGAA